MKHFLARLLGHDKEIRELTAQRAHNRELAMQYASQAQSLEALNSIQRERTREAARLVRQAHRQMNLRHSAHQAQGKLLEAARLLEGNADGEK